MSASAHAADFVLVGECGLEENCRASCVPGQATCRNCGAPAPGKFCPECGQETREGPTTLTAFLQEWRIRVMTRQGRLWQTLSRLLLEPGALAVEYRAGRRTRYVPPFQLYLAASVAVFAAVQIFGLDLGLRFFSASGVHLVRTSPLSVGAGADHAARLTPVQIIIDHVDTDAIRRFKAMSGDERFRFLQARRVLLVSYFVLILVPLFALITRLCYFNRRERFSTHLAFGLHLHTLLLLALLVEAKLPEVLASAMTIWLIAYFVAGLKRVYGGSWSETLGRGVAILALYFCVFFSANLLLVFGLLAT